MIRFSRAQTVLAVAAIGAASALAAGAAVPAMHAISASSWHTSCRGTGHRHCPSSSPTSPGPAGVSSSPAPRPTGTSPSLSPTTPGPVPTTSSPSPTPTSATPAPASTGSGGTYACTVTGFSNQCGSYSDPAIYGSTAGQVAYTGNQNVNLASGETGKMQANSLSDWQATINAPAGNTAVSEWSNSSDTLTKWTAATGDRPDPLSGYHSLTSNLTLVPQDVPGASYDNGWDVWGGDSGTNNNYAYEMMIWTNQLNRGSCGGGGTPVRHGVTFGSQTFSLCEWGTGSTGEFIWYLSDASGNPVNETSSSVDIYAMLQWMIAQGYYPPGYGLNQITAGSEVCSTGGHDMTITMSRWTLAKS